MPLAEKMLGLETLCIMVGEMRQQAGFWRRQVETHRLRVDNIDRHELAAYQDVVLRFFSDIRVDGQVFIPELDIFSTEGCPV